MARKFTPEDVLEEVKENRNHSWFEEVKRRHENELNRVVIKYLGTDITYGQYFKESYKWAKALKAHGIKKGDEFVVCMDKTPEFTYLLGAASIIGAKIKIISDKFNPEFIKDNIKRADSPYVFIQNVKLGKLKEIFKDLPNTKVVSINYERSVNPGFIHLDTVKKYYLSDYKPEDELAARNSITNIYDLEHFLEEGEKFTGKVEEEVTLDDPFTVTYSSGTTKKGQPKGIVHSVMHYVLMGRYHDREVSGIPEMKGLSTYSNIPVYSNSWLSSAFSDILMKSGVVILDPVDDPNYFSTGMRIHQSNFNIASTSTWLLNAISYYTKGEKYKLENALFNFAAGEALSPGEEKLLNKFQHDVKAGTAVTHTPVSVAKMSTAGADCEHGSLFIRIFRSYNNNKLLRKIIGEHKLNPLGYADGSDPIGMTPYGFSEVQVLRSNGTHAGLYEYGELVCNSPITMIGYDNDEEANNNFYRKDAYGNEWARMRVYGYVDESGNVNMKGRIPNNENDIPEFIIADAILQDTKNIMSCEVVSCKQNEETTYVAYVMPQLGRKSSSREEAVLKGIAGRCIRRLGNEIGYEVVKNLRVVFMDPSTPFPLTSSAKRDLSTLKNEAPSKIESSYKVVDYMSQRKKTSKKKQRIK